MTYVIHYLAGTVYDGCDIRETEHEYYALKELRKEQKKTQAEMAAAFGVSVRQYQNYEGGAFYPDVAGLMKMADYFDVSTDYLLGRSDRR